jgi:SnoaL-like domain
VTNTASAVQRLLDKEAIWESVLRYSRGLDRLDIALFRSAYWEDAVTCHGSTNGSVDDFLDWWLPLQENRECGQHAITNHWVELDSESEAHGETYFLVSIKNRDSDAVELVAGRYIDRFEKRGQEWRIKTRILIFEWQAILDGSQMFERMATNHKGTRDRNDPSYERPLQPRLVKP